MINMFISMGDLSMILTVTCLAGYGMGAVTIAIFIKTLMKGIDK